MFLVHNAQIQQVSYNFTELKVIVVKCLPF